MLDKNRDFVIAEHQALLGASALPLSTQLFSPDDAGAGGALPNSKSSGNLRATGGGLPSSKSTGSLRGSSGNLKGFQFVSVGSQFKRQLAELAAKLTELQPHYVRCIKPNPQNAPMQLDQPYALEQLKWVSLAVGCEGAAVEGAPRSCVHVD